MTIRFFTLLFTIILATTSFAQVRSRPFALYTTFGVKAAMGFSNIVNENMMGDDNLKYNSGLTYAYGLKTSVNYIAKEVINTILGIHVEYYWDDYFLDFVKVQTMAGTYQKKITYHTGNLSITGRYINVPGMWLAEAGAQITKFNNIKVENNGISPNNLPYIENYKYENNYNRYTSLVFGAGFFVHNFVVTVTQTIPLKSITVAGANPIKDGYYSKPTINSIYKNKYEKDVNTMVFTSQISVEYYLPVVRYKRYWRGKTEFSFFKKIDPTYYWGKDLD